MQTRPGRVCVTLPRLLRERLVATLQQRGWVDAAGQPERGAEVDVVTEWLNDYARLQGWDRVEGGAVTTERAGAAPADGDDDFGFVE